MTAASAKQAFEGAPEHRLPAPDLAVLRQGRRQPPPFPLKAGGEHLFGPLWGEWLSAAAEGAGAPVDYTAGALLASISALVGNARRICPWPSWDEPAALWVANVGLPSSNKSPGIDPVLRLLTVIEQEMATGFDAKLREWETDRKAAACTREQWDIDVKEAVKQERPPPMLPETAVEPPEPLRPRLVVNDLTSEKMAQLLAAHQRGLLFFRDELSGWLGGFDKYNGGGSDRAFWTESYGGRPFVVDRVKHREPICVPRLLIGCLGGIQPDPLADMIRGADDGLVARFLWLWPDAIPPRRPQGAVDPQPILRAMRRIIGLQFDVDADGLPQPRVLALTESAAAVFEAWRADHFAATQHSTGLVGSTLGKGAGHILRLALTIEIMRWAAGPVDAPEPMAVSKKAVAVAAHLYDDYFLPMAERVFGDAAIPEEDRLAATLARWIHTTKAKVVNPRVVRREARLPGLRKPERVKAAIESLIEANWLLPLPPPGGQGRPKEDHPVNPRLWEMLP